MKKTNKWPVAQAMLAAAMWAALGTVSLPAQAAVSAEEAAKLKTVLTPTGAERAGNKEGTIPEWKGGLTKPTPGFVNGGRRPDPFAGEAKQFSITAQNLDKYKDKLTPGTLALFAKYPQTYRLDVYQTHRSAAFPEAIYEKTAKNATATKVVFAANGRDNLEDYGGGIPFPIPKSGIEAIWNAKLHVWPTYLHMRGNNYLLQADGRKVLVATYVNDFIHDYGGKDSMAAGGIHMFVRSVNVAPPLRAGEGSLTWDAIDSNKTSSWVYLPGQRRVRRLPNACCDTPTPFSSGLISFDEISIIAGSLHRFDWKLIGKKEMYVPYNSNRTLVPTQDAAVLGEHHLNPDHVRWELHRVWVVEATLKPGERHPSAKGTYYIDEDSWYGVLAERYDANGTLARVGFGSLIALPDVPQMAHGTWAWYDLLSGGSYIANVYNEQSEQIKIMDTYPVSRFQPDALAGEGVR